jgi:hypothetical protein
MFENEEDWTISSQVPKQNSLFCMEKVQRLSRKGVHSSEWKCGTPFKDFFKDENELGEIFGVYRSTISDIRIGKKWHHLTKISLKKDRIKGGESHKAKLNDDQVREIKGKLRLGESNISIAKKFGISYQVISKIKNNRIWKHVN